MLYVGMYLIAIVAANLIISYFGPAATIITAFVFIGLDITARDKLHETWHGNGLLWKMFALILTGSIISYLLNQNTLQVGIASAVAFSVAATADALVYQKLFTKPWMLKVNASNIVSAALDSIIFPTIAFGAFMPAIILGQFLAKTFGGAIWAMIIEDRK